MGKLSLTEETGLEFGLGLSRQFRRRTIWIVDAHRDGKRSVVRADEKLDCVFAIRIGDSIRFTPSPRIRALISNFLMVYSV